jgi:protein-tyrosine-phosphatase
MNILVLCTGNSARSILLESILTHRSDGRITAYSAGSKPSGKVHPQSLVLLDREGFPTADLSSQSWDDYALPDAAAMDAVITVCGSAAGETCPMWPGVPVRAHWGVDDPATTTQSEWETAFDVAYNRLNKRAEALMDLPFEDMSPEALQSALTDIGTRF